MIILKSLPQRCLCACGATNTHKFFPVYSVTSVAKAFVYSTKKKPLSKNDRGCFILKPGGVLLSHGETPNYHRR